MRDGKKRENCRGIRSKTRKEETSGDATGSAESECSREGTRSHHTGCVSRKLGLSMGRGGDKCRAREGTQWPPYHQFGELPLLTRFPSLLGGPCGAAGNINQSHSDYEPLHEVIGSCISVPRGYQVAMTGNPRPRDLGNSSKSKFGLCDSETIDSFSWPFSMWGRTIS